MAWTNLEWMELDDQNIHRESSENQGICNPRIIDELLIIKFETF